MSDETLVPGGLAVGDHPAGYRLDEIVARGMGTDLLVVDTDSRQAPACQIAPPP